MGSFVSNFNKYMLDKFEGSRPVTYTLARSRSTIITMGLLATIAVLGFVLSRYMSMEHALPILAVAGAGAIGVGYLAGGQLPTRKTLGILFGTVAVALTILGVGSLGHWISPHVLKIALPSIAMGGFAATGLYLYITIQRKVKGKDTLTLSDDTTQKNTSLEKPMLALGWGTTPQRLTTFLAGAALVAAFALVEFGGAQLGLCPQVVNWSLVGIGAGGLVLTAVGTDKENRISKIVLAASFLSLGLLGGLHQAHALTDLHLRIGATAAALAPLALAALTLVGAYIYACREAQRKRMRS